MKIFFHLQTNVKAQFISNSYKFLYVSTSKYSVVQLTLVQRLEISKYKVKKFLDFVL